MFDTEITEKVQNKLKDIDITKDINVDKVEIYQNLKDKEQWVIKIILDNGLEVKDVIHKEVFKMDNIVDRYIANHFTNAIKKAVIKHNQRDFKNGIIKK
ncbi:hypothetical protein [Clostridium pasteurianum]|uniref:Uncharacterized protein n=1 Tax=Clostridium pasteurianum BC1 TaxID=86416 RepID=R4K2I4_CLOPA|nr:hypothetical protein [Clostridium pasteurianum]AGK96793.1 hypothetical protein Clopa_1893 [Clostridium pasteurianum BC1]